MKIYQCSECDSLFDEPSVYSEYMGEYWGAPAYETFEGCPYCNSGYVEVTECDICGEIVPADRTYRGVCYECADTLEVAI